MDTEQQPQSTEPPSPLDVAIEKAGGQVELASACHVTPQAVNQWAKKGRAPASRVLLIEAATGVSRHDLRPDVFGPRTAEGRAAA